MKFTAIILAGGKGKRFGSSIPKPFMSLNGKPVIQYAIDVIEPLVDELIIVSNRKYKDYKCVKGGRARSESVLNGLNASKGEYIIIHDGARPFVRAETIIDIKEKLQGVWECVDTRSPIIDGFVDRELSLPKTGRYLGLTPEGFRRQILVYAFSKTKRRDWQDEITMVQQLLDGVRVAFIEGESFNSKITYPEDLAYAEGIMKFWARPITTKPDLHRKALVYGGSSGIGKKCVEILRHYQKLIPPTREQCDLATTDWEAFVKPYKAIIYSAGEYLDKDKIMQVNFHSFVRLVEMAEEQGFKGNIVALSSTASTCGRKGIALYSASKSALNAYIEARAEELSKKGIYINAIAPAKVDTRLQKAINPSTPKEDMLTTDYVADYVLRYIDTKVFGHIIYLRKGFDKR